MFWLSNAAIVILTFLAMEFVAWATHKFVMHGFLWILHKDHHEPHPHVMERNDAFFLIFAIPGILFLLFGALNGYDFRFYIGAGITLYGMAYFLVHDVFIHQRISWFRRSDNRYLRAIRKAHKVHHKKAGKEDGESFGMLIVARKFFAEQRRDS